MLRHLWVTILALTLLSNEARADARNSKVEWSSWNTIALGSTDNANLEQEEKDADFFAQLRTSNRWMLGATAIGFRLNYTDYANQQTNDVLSWRVSSTHIPKAWKADLNLETALFGQIFTREAPGFSEESFSYFGASLGVLKELDLTRRLSLTVGPELQLKSFTSMGGRWDQVLLLSAELDYLPSSSLEFLVGAKMGYSGSSLPEYRNYHLELSGIGSYRIRKPLAFEGELAIRQSSYPGRPTAIETVVSRKRGGSQTATTFGNERMSNVYLRAGLIYDFRTNLKGSVALSHVGNSSRSATQDYSTNELSVSATLSL